MSEIAEINSDTAIHLIIKKSQFLIYLFFQINLRDFASSIDSAIIFVYFKAFLLPETSNLNNIFIVHSKFKTFFASK